MIRTTRMTRICTRIATPSTIIGRAASTGMTRTTTDMMTVTTDFGTRGSFSYSIIQINARVIFLLISIPLVIFVCRNFAR